jgi:plasmid stabilization system protein ParE
LDFEIRFSEPALTDPESVLEYCWTNFSSTAERFGNSLLNHIEILSAFPRMGVHVRDRPGIRKIFHSPYTIYYRIDDRLQVVEILHIWHGSRRKPDL